MLRDARKVRAPQHEVNSSREIDPHGEEVRSTVSNHEAAMIVFETGSKLSSSLRRALATKQSSVFVNLDCFAIARNDGTATPSLLRHRAGRVRRAERFVAGDGRQHIIIVPRVLGFFRLLH